MRALSENGQELNSFFGIFQSNSNFFFLLGQERFRSVTRSYFRRADGVMLLYDVTSDRSYLSVRQWIEAVDVSTDESA